MQAENLPFDPYLRTYVDQLVRDAARKHECYAADIYNPRRRRPVRCGGVSAARYAVIRALQQTVYRRERSVVEKRTRTDLKPLARARFRQWLERHGCC